MFITVTDNLNFYINSIDPKWESTYFDSSHFNLFE